MDPLEGKKQENIAGYVISMWHIEDLMRAQRFDAKAIEEQLIEPMEADEETRDEVRDWYMGIMDRMKEEGLESSGHLSEVEEVMNELEFLHHSLTEVLKDADYTALWKEVRPAITMLQEKAGEDADGAVTTCFTAIYGVMLLRAQEREITKATAEADVQIRDLLELLSQHYRNMRRLPGVSMN